jgi:predicted Zn-dependent peptidase
VIGVYVGTGENTFSSVLKIIRREMRKLAEDSLKSKELRSAKEQLKGNLLLSLESTDSRMGRLAKSEIYFHRFVSTEEIIEGIESVSAEEVAELAQQVFQRAPQSLTVLGPVTEKDIPREVLEP